MKQSIKANQGCSATQCANVRRRADHLSVGTQERIVGASKRSAVIHGSCDAHYNVEDRAKSISGDQRPHATHGIVVATPKRHAADQQVFATHYDDVGRDNLCGGDQEIPDAHFIDVAAQIETGGDQRPFATHGACVSSGSDAEDHLTLLLAEQQVQRRATIKEQRRLNQSCLSLLRRYMGWHDADESGRKRINVESLKLIKLIESEKQIPIELKGVVYVVEGYVLAIKSSRERLDSYRLHLEKLMRNEAGRLRVWPWCQAIRGFAELGLAIIVGESGNLLNYSNPAKLWKRMGVGIVGGCRQGSPGKEATAEDWIAHGYKKERRSALWTIGDCLIKQNDGEYRKLYDDRKAYERGRSAEMSDMQIHRRAQRYMEKRLLVNLWKEWRRIAKASA